MPENQSFQHEQEKAKCRFLSVYNKLTNSVSFFKKNWQEIQQSIQQKAFSKDDVKLIKPMRELFLCSQADRNKRFMSPHSSKWDKTKDYSQCKGSEIGRDRFNLITSPIYQLWSCCRLWGVLNRSIKKYSQMTCDLKEILFWKEGSPLFVLKRGNDEISILEERWDSIPSPCAMQCGDICSFCNPLWPTECYP